MIYVIISAVTGVLAFIYALRFKKDTGKQITLFFTAIFCVLMALLIHYDVLDGVYFLLNIVFYGVMSLIVRKVLRT